jgi:hypothetical protein
MSDMRYALPTFSLPVANARISEAEYALRVGKITQEEYDRLPEVKAESNTST